jgi:MFS family permease
MPYTILMPIFADRILHSGARGLGILMCATGVGAVLGALTLAAKTRFHGLGRWIALSAAGFGLSLILFAFSKDFLLSVVLLVPVGFCMMVQMASSNTLIQAMVPNDLRGRIMSLYSMMFMGMAPIGALAGGALAARLGAPITVAMGAIVAMGSAALFALRLPKMRMKAGRLIVTQARVCAGRPQKMSA